MRRLLAFALLALLAIAQPTSSQSTLSGDIRITGALQDASGNPALLRRVVTLGGDVTDSAGNNTYTDCTGLSFAVTNGVRAHFSARIWYTSAATTTGSAWSINGPTNTDLSYTASYVDSQTARILSNRTGYDTPATSSAGSLTAGNIALIDGTILPSANGTVIVRFMTEIDTSAIVCKAGSTIEWW